MDARDEARKRHYASQLGDIEYEDIEHLPIEDVAAIVERRHEQELQAVREVREAVKVLISAFSQVSEDRRRDAKRGLARLIEEGDPETSLCVIEGGVDSVGIEEYMERRARDAAARRTTDGEDR